MRQSGGLSFTRMPVKVVQMHHTRIREAMRPHTSSEGGWVTMEGMPLWTHAMNYSHEISFLLPAARWEWRRDGGQAGAVENEHKLCCAAGQAAAWTVCALVLVSLATAQSPPPPPTKQYDLCSSLLGPNLQHLTSFLGLFRTPKFLPSSVRVKYPMRSTSHDRLRRILMGILTGLACVLMQKNICKLFINTPLLNNPIINRCDPTAIFNVLPVRWELLSASSGARVVEMLAGYRCVGGLTSNDGWRSRAHGAPCRGPLGRRRRM